MGEDQKLLGSQSAPEEPLTPTRVHIASWWTLAVVCMSASVLVLLLSSNAGSKLVSKSLSLSYTNDDTWSYTFTSISGTPLGIYCSETGQYAITSDTDGNIYRSVDYGSSWSSSQSIEISSGKYASIYGLVMNEEGKEMIAGTGTHATYYSSDYGSSWTKLSSQKCSQLAADTTLTKLACVGGLVDPNSMPPSPSYIMVSKDGGETWSKAPDLDEGEWIGVIADEDFENVVASVYTDVPYFYMSSDGASSFVSSNYSEALIVGKWGSLAGDKDLSHIALTDVYTKNVHLSVDMGNTFFKVYNGADWILGPSVNLTSAVVSRDGTGFALGFTAHPLTTIFNCVFECSDDWVEQTSAVSTSKSSDFSTTGLAISETGKYLFSTDANTLQIGVGVISD